MVLLHAFGWRDFDESIQIVELSASDNPNNFGASSIFTWLQADTLAHPGSLEVTSKTLATLACDAGDPCSVHAAYEPESFFTTSPRDTTGLLYFGNFFSVSGFLR